MRIPSRPRFAGLASASGLGSHLYPGWGNRELRKRLDQMAKGQVRTTPPWPTPPRSTAAGMAEFRRGPR